MIHATKKKQKTTHNNKTNKQKNKNKNKKQQLLHNFIEGKCHLVLYLAINLYANICLHHNIKGLNISTAAASQRETAKRKVSSLRQL